MLAACGRPLCHTAGGEGGSGGGGAVDDAQRARTRHSRTRNAVLVIATPLSSEWDVDGLACKSDRQSTRGLAGYRCAAASAMTKVRTRVAGAAVVRRCVERGQPARLSSPRSQVRRPSGSPCTSRARLFFTATAASSRQHTSRWLSALSRGCELSWGRCAAFPYVEASGGCLRLPRGTAPNRPSATQRRPRCCVFDSRKSDASARARAARPRTPPWRPLRPAASPLPSARSSRA